MAFGVKLCGCEFVGHDVTLREALQGLDNDIHEIRYVVRKNGEMGHGAWRDCRVDLLLRKLRVTSLSTLAVSRKGFGGSYRYNCVKGEN